MDEQLDLLEERGITIDDRLEAERFLLREGAFPVIHSYKDAFLDRDRSRRTGRDFFRPGTTFEFFRSLYLTDRYLRNEALGCLLLAEAAIKSCNIEALCDEFDDPEFYLDKASYKPERLYRPKPNHTYEMDLNSLLYMLMDLRKNHRLKRDYIQHYKDVYGVVPIWVLSQIMTFGCYAKFYQLQTDRVHERTRHYLARALDRRVRGSEIERALNVLPDFRNVCAHGERLYCAKVGAQRAVGFGSILDALRSVITEGEFAAFVGKIRRAVEGLDGVERQLGDVLLEGMGIDRDWIASVVA